ncbi:MAG: hypothetical protein R2762_27585 [Bryobacteraceae bacterium]
MDQDRSRNDQPPPYAEYARLAEARITAGYGIPVVTRDIPDPLTGDLDGAEIHIDYAVTPEQRLFLLAHLFGHTVQWNKRADALEIGQLHKPPVESERLAMVLDYEREAAEFALTLLHEAGVLAADQWLSDYSGADLAYLRHYYVTGERRPFSSFRVHGGPMLAAKPIPPFTPSRKVFRMDGIVI